MGYLDNSSITVDAVLTKKGRQIISEGGALDVQYFTLSDTGVDYTLWNEDHSSGSAYYGEAIENLPMVEALPNSQYSFRNKLVTLNRDTVSMPTLEVTPDSTIFSTNVAKDFTTNLIGYVNAVNASNGKGGVHLIVPDINIATSLTGAQVDVTGNALAFVRDQDVQSTRVFEITGTGKSHSVSISPASNLTADTKMTLTFIDIKTGAYEQTTITVKSNLISKTKVASQGVQIG